MQFSPTSPAEKREARVVGVVALLVLAALVVRATMGINLYDGAFYVVVPLRIAQGARLFADEMAVQALGSLIAVPFVKVWTALFGLTAISLATSLYYLALASVAAWFGYRLLRPSFRPAAAALAVGLPLLAPPYHLLFPTYNTVAQISFVLATCLALAAIRDDSRAKAAGVGIALVVGTLAYPPLVVAALAFFVTFAVFARRAPRLIGALLLAGAITAAVCAAALFSAVTLAELKAALAFATANVGHIGRPTYKMRYNAGHTLGALFQQRLLPMWLLALVASLPWLPRWLRAGALATIPLAAAGPGAILVARANDFKFGAAAATWYLIFLAGVLPPVLVWAVERRRTIVLKLLALTAPFSVIGFLAVAYSTNSSWHRGVPVIAMGALGVALVAGWAECLGETGVAALSAGSAFAIIAVLGLLYSTIFGDAGLLLPRDYVPSGPYAGITTSVQHAADVRAITAAGQRYVKPGDRVLMLGIRDAYLMVGGRIDTPAVWLPPQQSDAAAIEYFSRPGNAWPDIVFVDDSPIIQDGGYVEHAQRDPLLRQVMARYRFAEKVSDFSVFVRK